MAEFSALLATLNGFLWHEYVLHFQALSAALSATVGLGNIGGVALAIALGGPGAVFWMWVIGLLGMSIKLTEVTLSMLYRNTDDPDNPHGAPSVSFFV